MRGLRDVIGVVVALALTLVVAGCPTTSRGTLPVDHSEQRVEPDAVSSTDPEGDGARAPEATSSSDAAVTQAPEVEAVAAPAPCVPSEPHGPGEPIALVGDIVFDFDDREIRRESYPVLDALTETLRRETRFCRVDIVVHAMRPEYPRAQRLGHIRAESVHHYLAAHGIEVARLHFTGLDDAERREDRRVEILGHEDGCPCPFAEK